MKHYTVEIVTKAGVTSQAIFERTDIDVAKKEFHNTLAYNINLEGVEKVSVAVVNEELIVLMKETWEAPKQEPTPKTESTPKQTGTVSEETLVAEGV